MMPANLTGLSRPIQQNRLSLKEGLDLVDLNQLFKKPVGTIRVLSLKKGYDPGVFRLNWMAFLRG